jgi:RNA polymerase sigma factor (sigma-70 family)
MASETNAAADAAGDGQFTELLTQFDPLIKRAARRASYYLNGTASLADDLAQDVRCHLWEALQTKPTSNPAFVRKVVTNALRSRIRFERCRLQLGSEDVRELDERLPGVLDSYYTDGIDRLFIAKWVSELPGRLHMVFDALYKQGYTQREASKALRVSQPRVTQLHRELLDRGRLDLLALAA